MTDKKHQTHMQVGYFGTSVAHVNRHNLSHASLLLNELQCDNFKVSSLRSRSILHEIGTPVSNAEFG